MSLDLKRCSFCCMDGSAKELTLDENGRCNFCEIAQKELAWAESIKPNFQKLYEKIKKDGRKGKYDVLVGMSGGADSSTVLHEIVSIGLRPLAFSIDNGWNTPQSDENIMRLVESLKVPFFRYTIDYKKFFELQGAFLKAGLINAEIPTDHVLMASTYEIAAQYGIKWVASGGNTATESIMPPSWSFNARDLTHIKDVYKWATGGRLDGGKGKYKVPLCGIWLWNYYRWVKGIKIFYPLDYLGYHRANAIKNLEEKYGWIDYVEKHCESTFTKWYQNFYLFEKFSIDKRKAHLSSMINSGQIARSQALQELLKSPEYPKIGLEAKVMTYPKRSHDYFKKDKWYGRIAKVCRFLNLRTHY